VRWFRLQLGGIDNVIVLTGLDDIDADHCNGFHAKAD
jgi:hypothetical protein